ncbi:Lysophospholipid acyltransferase LPEAT1 [Galdieria sulphuraria]|nr:Lysophospholipid acyltransferase LPEAT1 [Galdieria sulphuraria]
MTVIETTSSLEDSRFDPFKRNDKSFDWIELVKFPLVFVIFPFRFFGALLSVLGCYFFFLIFGPSVRQNIAAEVSTSRRQLLLRGGKCFSRACLFFLGFYRVCGRQHSSYDSAEAKKYVLVCNHTSMLDILILMSVCMQCIYVNRASRGGVSAKVIERQQACMEQRPVAPLVIFPEATTTNGHFLIKFHTGVFRGGFPVVPVVIKYRYRRFSPTYETIRSAYYIYKLFTQLYNEAEYTLLPIYYPNEVEKNDPLVYANNVRAVMQKELKCSLSESSYQDKLVYHGLLRKQDRPKQL